MGDGLRRIAVVHSYYSSRQPSGENQVVDQQMSALDEAGYPVALFAQRTDEHQGRWDYPLRAAARVATGLGPHPLDGLRAFKPDVVLVNNLFPNYGRNWVRRWTGPLVAVMHNHRPMCPAGTFFRDGEACTDCLASRSAKPAIRHGCYRDSRIATLPVAMGTKFGDDPVLRRADRVVVLNPSMQALYEQAGVQAGRIARIPNFIARAGEAGEGGTRWLFVGRLTAEKGILPLMREWPAGAPLDVVGSGPLRAEVERLSPPGVMLLGEQPPDRVQALMRHARGLIFPSRCFEGFPMVYLEALAAGTPLIAWDPSAAAALVREEGTGLVAGDLRHTLHEADEAFPSMRERCRAVFDERYTRTAWLAAMESLFDEVAPRR
jgi:glycosyltransferase involved in cell wall biosynthesis